MFREIRRSERITDTDRNKQRRRDEILDEMLNARVGSEEFRRWQAELNKLEERIDEPAFDPDARI